MEQYYRILEEIINEVSVGAWSRAAKSSLPKRKDKYVKASIDAATKERDLAKEGKMDNGGVYVEKYIKPTKKGAPRKKVNLNRDVDWDQIEKDQNEVRDLSDKAKKAKEKALHAQEVSDTLNSKSKVGANKLMNAAWNNAYKYKLKSEDDKASYLERKRAEKKYAKADKYTDLDRVHQRKSAKDAHYNYLYNSNSWIGQSLRDSDNRSKARLEDTYKNRKATQKAGEEHQNAQINQGLRNKFEKIYKASEALSEACIEDILSRVERILWQD